MLRAIGRSYRDAFSGLPRQVWVLRDGQPVAIAVTAGLTDGRVTEVTSDQLQPGMAVITDQRSGASQ